VFAFVQGLLPKAERTCYSGEYRLSRSIQRTYQSRSQFADWNQNACTEWIRDAIVEAHFGTEISFDFLRVLPTDCVPSPDRKRELFVIHI
jgi:hypothetical protein